MPLLDVPPTHEPRDLVLLRGHRLGRARLAAAQALPGCAQLPLGAIDPGLSAQCPEARQRCAEAFARLDPPPVATQALPPAEPGPRGLERRFRARMYPCAVSGPPVIDLPGAPGMPPPAGGPPHGGGQPGDLP